MHKLNRYIGRRVAAAILLVLLVIVGVDVLASVIDQLEDVRGNYTFLASLQYVAMTVPGRFYEFLPFAALVGCLAGLGTLAGNSELVVMRAAGVSTLRLVWATMKPALAISLVGLLLAEFIAPPSQQIAESFRAVALQEEGKAHSEYGMWHREGNRYMHFNAVQPNGVLHGVSIYRFGPQRQLEQSLYAARASYIGDRWLLEEVKTVSFGERRAHRETHGSLGWTTELTPELLNILVLEPADLSISGLWRYASYLREQGINSASYLLSFWNKLLQPLMILGLVLVAISFIFGPLREVTMGFRVFVGVLIGVVFRMLQDMLGPASLVFGFAPVYASIGPIALSFAVGTALMMRRV